MHSPTRAGIAENSGLARWLPGGSDVWGAMLRSQTRSDGSPLDVRTISEGLTPTEPELASLGVMFTLYEPGANVMGQPIFKEATMLMEARWGGVGCDLWSLYISAGAEKVNSCVSAAACHTSCWCPAGPYP